MTKYILKRLLMSLITIFFIITITFFLMHAAPGSPFNKENDKMPETVRRNLEAKYGLDKPLGEQYVIHLKNIAHLDFGQSMKSKAETVNEMIARGFPVSARLGFQALFLALIIGPLLGSIAALYQNRAPDYVAMIFAIIGISVPSFIMGTLLIQMVAGHGMPISGWGTFSHTVLPTIALSFMPAAQMARLMRSSMLEVLGQDYMKTAKSKGISKTAVILKHGVRNSILPVISVLGTIAADLMMGSFVIEKIFGIPGLGRFFIKSITDRDYTLIMGITTFYGIVLVLMILFVDIAYTLIDPRIKLEGGTN